MYIDLRKRPRGKEHLKVKTRYITTATKKNRYIMEEVSRAGLSILPRPAWCLVFVSFALHSVMECICVNSLILISCRSLFSQSPCFCLSSLTYKSLSGVIK